MPKIGTDKNVNQSFRIPKETRDLFQRTYPYTMSKFLLNSIRYALADRKYFEAVYFGDYKND